MHAPIILKPIHPHETGDEVLLRASHAMLEAARHHYHLQDVEELNELLYALEERLR